MVPGTAATPLRKAETRATQLPTPLMMWLRTNGMTVGQLASHLGCPNKTVQDWVYKGSRPSSPDVRSQLYQLTELDDYAPSNARPQAPPSAEQRATRRLPSALDVLARDVQQHMNRVSEILEFFRRSDADARGLLRHHINPQAIARTSALFRAILSEERLREFEIASTVSDSLMGARGSKNDGGDHSR